MYIQNSNRLTDIEGKLVVTKGEEELIRDVGLIDTNYHTQDRSATRIHCITQAVVPIIL